MDLPGWGRGPGGMGRRWTYLNGGGVLVAWAEDGLEDRLLSSSVSSSVSNSVLVNGSGSSSGLQ